MSDPEIERLLAEARRNMPPAPAASAAPSDAGPPASSPPRPAAGSARPGAAAPDDGLEGLPPGAAAALSRTEARTPAAAPGAGEGLLARALALRIAGVLTSRYVDLKLSDLGGTLILILQAPLVGYLVSLAFDGKKESAALQFVLAMVAVWFGTFNACREVVKERLIFLRERRSGVPVRAYLLSKVGVLSVLAVLQCLLLVALVARTVRFDSSTPLVFLTLLVTALASTALGLLLSSAVKSQNSLIALVPIVLIPQLIFSEVVLGTPSQLVERIELTMLAHWSYDVLRELRRSDVEWLEVAKGVGVLLGMGVGFLTLAALCLRAQDED